MTRSRRLWLAFLLAFFTFSTKVGAAIDDGDSFETIVSELSGSTRARKPVVHHDPFNDILIHGGLAVANTFGVIRTAGGQRLFTHQQGLQASLGIDLFTQSLSAEGAFCSFADYTTANSRVSLHEFDLKFLNRTKLAAKLSSHLGLGLSARYMKVSEAVATSEIDPLKPRDTTPLDVDSEYITPSSVLLAGLDAFLTERMSVGIESSYRSSLISETVDRVSYDVLFRVDAHF